MVNLKIHILPALKDNFIYALSDSKGRCAVIDVGDAEPVRQLLAREKLSLSYILCTHHHWDHTDGVAALKAKFNVPVWASTVDSAKIKVETEHLQEGQTHNLLGAELKIIEVPGHTLGQICFWFPEMQAVFVGDTLFSCGCGRLFEGTYEQLFSSLAKISALPPTTEIYFGHEYTLNNIRFLNEQGVRDENLNQYKIACEKKLAAGQPTTPGLLETELKLNPFLKAKTVEELRQWREARNSW